MSRTVKQREADAKANSIKYLSKGITLPERVEAWCKAEFDESKVAIEPIISGIIAAASSGIGNKFEVDIAAMICKRHAMLSKD